MRTSLNRKSRRLFLERLEHRFALDGDGFDDPLPPPDPPPPDPPVDESPGDPGDSGDPGNPGDPGDPPPDTNCDGNPDPPPSNDPPTDPGDPPTGPEAPPDPGDPPTSEDPPANPPPPPPPPPDPGEIDPSTLPGPDATPGEIAALSSAEYNAWCMANNYIDGGYIGYAGDPNPAVPPPPPPQQNISQSAAQELTNLGSIFDQALYLYQSQAANSSNGTNQLLGQGWWGNISGAGPECDQVFDGVSNAINQVMQQQYGNHTFDDYTFATIVAGGMFAPTGISDHVYFGIVNKNTGDLEYFMDPWRNVMFFQMNPIQADPNWNVQEVNPWTFVPPPPMASQDPLQGSPPGDDGHWVIH